MIDYTIEVVKTDRRLKEGQKIVKKIDFLATLEQVEAKVEHLKDSMYPGAKGFTVTFTETYVEKTNLMTGLTYKERYDTPYYCSPSSETYWST